MIQTALEVAALRPPQREVPLEEVVLERRRRVLAAGVPVQLPDVAVDALHGDVRHCASLRWRDKPIKN